MGPERSPGPAFGHRRVLFHLYDGVSSRLPKGCQEVVDTYKWAMRTQDKISLMHQRFLSKRTGFNLQVRSGY